MKKLLLSVLFTLLFLNAFAADSIGSVVRFTGKVTVFDGSSPRGTDITAAETPIYPNNIITTNRTSRAIVVMNSGDRIAISENSTLTFPNESRYEPGKGKVVFSIRKRGMASGIKIGLKTAVIGVKGTEFLIDTDNDDTTKVYLKDGEIAVDSVSGDFVKHNAIQMDEYTAFVTKLTGEYDKYVEQLQKEYTDYVKSFSMESGQAVVIKGNDVSDIQFNDDIDSYFQMLD